MIMIKVILRKVMIIRKHINKNNNTATNVYVNKSNNDRHYKNVDNNQKDSNSNNNNS